MLQRETAHCLLHPAFRWSLIGSTGRSDVYGYNLIVGCAGEGGRYLQVEGEQAFALLPPSPIRRSFARSNTRKEGGVRRPTKRCVSPIADGWGSVVAAVLRGRCLSLGAQEFGRAG